jgi:hypothetical protein
VSGEKIFKKNITNKIPLDIMCLGFYSATHKGGKGDYMKKLIVFFSLFFCYAKFSMATNYPVIYEDSTPKDVAAIWVPYMSKQLDNCFNQYKKEINKDAKLITLKVAKEFISNYPYNGESIDGYCYAKYDLENVIIQIFKEQKREEALPEVIKEWMKSYSLVELNKCTINGIVTFDSTTRVEENEKRCRYSLFYDQIEEARKQNALARAINSEGTSYKWLMDQWKSVGKSNLDKDFFNPILIDPKILDKKELFNCMRKNFYLNRLSYISNGDKAIDDFWNSHEGPEGDEDFLPIINVLKTKSFKKYFYFSGVSYGNDGWSSNVLIVVDQHNQMFGFQMGYSE